MLDELKGSSTDLMENLTLANLYSYIDSALGAWEQHPVFKTNISTFSPIRKVHPPIDINLLKKISVYFPNYTDEFSLDPSYEFKSSYPDKNHVKIFK